MKKCKSCNFTYNTDRYTCPFCKNRLEETNEQPLITYQPYPKFKDKIHKTNLVQKIFVFLTLIASLVVTITNYYNYKKGINSLWSVITLIGIITLWSFIKGIIISKKSGAKRVFNFGLCLILLILSIEYLSLTKKGNYSNWSLNYVIPFILIGILSAINFIIIIRKKTYTNNVGYALWTPILLIAYYLLYIFDIVTVAWPSISCLVYGFSSLIAIFFFGGKATIQELKKRLTL